MSSKFKTFNAVFNNVVQKNQRFLRFTMAIEFQKEAKADFDSLLKKTTTMKKIAINQKNEKLSNQFLSLEYLLLTYINELEMYLNLKADKMSDAWDSLVNAQTALRTSLQIDDIALAYQGAEYARKLELLEQAIFPHQTFNSIEAKIYSSKCSICDQEYGACNHLVGKAYMGKLCQEVVTKAEFVGLALLFDKHPASKHHRITQVSDADYMRDILTWRIVKPISEDIQKKVK